MQAFRFFFLCAFSAALLAAGPGMSTVAASLPGYEAVYGAFAPAKTPPATIRMPNQAMVNVIKSPEHKAAFQKPGIDAVGGTPEFLASAVKSDYARMGKLIKEAGIREE